MFGLFDNVFQLFEDEILIVSDESKMNSVEFSGKNWDLLVRDHPVEFYVVE
jgi:hypothetical protein